MKESQNIQKFLHYQAILLFLIQNHLKILLNLIYFHLKYIHIKQPFIENIISIMKLQ